MIELGIAKSKNEAINILRIWKGKNIEKKLRTRRSDELG
ncbi:hypothetical protein HNQ62_001611 [Sulfurisphaera ohwakuensis]|uniref:Uncharacterized protein n=1 Tax=Sulfurisphaera ohwakuensis TaxID=69656 RepID=A0A7J9RUH6_SULOH|nr:hypothetical protein [Sulfurisphaera ohwakuensis]